MAKQGKKKQGATKKSSPKRPAKAKKSSGSKQPPAKKPIKKPDRGGAKPSKARKPEKKPGAKKPLSKRPPVKERPETGGPIIAADAGDTAWRIEPAGAAPALTDLVGKAMIINILGDAEAFFFDFTKLAPARRQELIAHHLAAFDQRKKDEGKSDWHDQFVPIALLGESMPPAIRGQFDLSAPHEGVVLHHPGSGALLYAASKDDDKLAILAPDLDTISPHPSYVSDVFDPDQLSFAYEVDRSQSAGFTLGEIETLMQTAGAELTLV